MTAEPVFDPEVCQLCWATKNLIATPEGPMCKAHAADLAEELNL